MRPKRASRTFQSYWFSGSGTILLLMRLRSGAARHFGLTTILRRRSTARRSLLGEATHCSARLPNNPAPPTMNTMSKSSMICR